MIMKNKSFTEIIHLAQNGNCDAQDELLRQFEGLIDRNCFVDGVFDYDCRQYIMQKIIRQLPKFRGEKKIL